MDGKDYFWLTRKKEPKTKPKSRPLPKAKQKYLEAEATLKEELEDLAIGFESKFQPIHTKHWRFDFHIVKLRLLIEIEGGPWSGGRGGKLSNKAWSLDRYDVAEEMGYTVIRIEAAPRFKINESGPLQIQAHFASQWLKNLKRQIFNGSDQTISSN
ncbi:hypothetical protein [Acinetobacter baumannii]|uniref:hypothetical protein n=2 Tax=Acinetobacter baumannii TaxID=470 RepID=UPI000B53F822|nr:hypothetical protein [Acinetobacter baumannii]OWX29085.1 hypothetical protein A7A41_18590 [Acinetobacter baumannii]TLT29406.1 hypothetical protein FD898_18310 [Acinetobacter baumannii]TLT38930.1 hypothetical protein FD875_17915 [Acinetobacter baumannii]TLT59983.1 hypothetical protein FD913_21010 [Acinetobacter baumannii]